MKNPPRGLSWTSRLVALSLAGWFAVMSAAAQAKEVGQTSEPAATAKISQAAESVVTRSVELDHTSSTLDWPTTGPLDAHSLGNGVWWRPTFDEATAERVFSDLERRGFRNVFVESFWGGATIFPSPHFPHKTGDGKDWLAIFCAIGARHHVRVHAWIHTFFWQYGQDSRTSTSLVAIHPDWVEIPRGQVPIRSGEKDYVFVSPAHPGVRAKLSQLIDELCRRPIAGINLDYIRYPHTEPECGYNPVAVQRFLAETGLDARTLTPDLSPSSPWMRWVAFRERMVTETVEGLAQRVRQLGTTQGRRIAVSAAFFPGYVAKRGENPKCQNWPEWVRAGLLDFSTPMCYSPTLAGLRQELEEVRDTHAGTRVVPLPGLAVGTFTSPHPPYAEQLRLVRKFGFPCHAVFKYETLVAETASER